MLRPSQSAAMGPARKGVEMSALEDVRKYAARAQLTGWWGSGKLRGPHLFWTALSRWAQGSSAQLSAAQLLHLNEPQTGQE